MAGATADWVQQSTDLIFEQINAAIEDSVHELEDAGLDPSSYLVVLHELAQRQTGDALDVRVIPHVKLPQDSSLDIHREKLVTLIKQPRFSTTAEIQHLPKLLDAKSNGDALTFEFQDFHNAKTKAFAALREDLGTAWVTDAQRNSLDCLVFSHDRILCLPVSFLGAPLVLCYFGQRDADLVKVTQAQALAQDWTRLLWPFFMHRLQAIIATVRQQVEISFVSAEEALLLAEKSLAHALLAKVEAAPTMIANAPAGVDVPFADRKTFKLPSFALEPVKLSHVGTDLQVKAVAAFLSASYASLAQFARQQQAIRETKALIERVLPNLKTLVVVADKLVWSNQDTLRAIVVALVLQRSADDAELIVEWNGAKRKLSHLIGAMTSDQSVDIRNAMLSCFDDKSSLVREYATQFVELLLSDRLTASGTPCELAKVATLFYSNDPPCLGKCAVEANGVTATVSMEKDSDQNAHAIAIVLLGAVTAWCRSCSAVDDIVIVGCRGSVTATWTAESRDTRHLDRTSTPDLESLCNQGAHYKTNESFARYVHLLTHIAQVEWTCSREASKFTCCLTVKWES